MSETVDFLSICSEGMVLRTRDRGEATITRIAAADGTLYGEVRMFGPCRWRRDGIYSNSPCAAAGPLDLMPPGPPDAPARQHKRVKMQDALSAGNRLFCCD
jgi:hypothetical protein